jgi:hypothetical protein
VHVTKAPASSLHWKLVASPPLKANVGELSLLGFGGVDVIEAVGAAVSIVHVYAVAAPVFPATSVALTEKVCAPSGALNVWGDVHVAKAPVSSLH